MCDEEYVWVGTGSCWINDRELTLREQAERARKKKVKFGFQPGAGYKPRRCRGLTIVS